MCPVFVATTDDGLAPDPDEVDDARWVDWPEFRAERAGRQPRGQPVVPRAGAAAAAGSRRRAGPSGWPTCYPPRVPRPNGGTAGVVPEAHDRATREAMSTASTGYLERPAPSGLADVIEIILDKGSSSTSSASPSSASSS